MSEPPDSHGDDHADDSLLYHAYDPDLTGEMTTTPVSRLDRRGLVGVIQSTQAAINRLLGLQYEAAAAFARTAGDRSVKDPTSLRPHSPTTHPSSLSTTPRPPPVRV